MLQFLFWNLKTDNFNVLASIVRHHVVDVLILAECPMLPATVLKALNSDSADFFYAPSGCPKIQLYVRFSEQFVTPIMRHGSPIIGDDFSLRLLALPGRKEILLCSVHFPSKLRQKPIDQTDFAMQFAKILGAAEDSAGHSNTVLVGDLNMNPYDDGVVISAGLHAVMTRQIARKETRQVKFPGNLYFYNPMWSHFGEKTEKHAGTYYLASPKARADFWNIYDQVLVRPSLLPHFRDEDVSIVWMDVAGNRRLIKSDGRPDRDTSDHLPVRFALRV